MAAIDGKGSIIVSKIGEWEHKHILNKHSNVNMYVEVKGNNIIFGTLDEGIKTVVEKITFDNIGITEIGIACKTWGNGERLKVDFNNIIT